MQQDLTQRSFLVRDRDYSHDYISVTRLQTLTA